MRIAYIAPYQGPGLVKRRPIIRNLSLAARIKINLIAESLQRASHSVEILSQGEVVDHQFRFYSGFREPELFDQSIPISYSSAFPAKFLNGLWSSVTLLNLFKKSHRKSRFEVVIIYNLKPPQVMCASYAIRHLGLPVILEYEDSAFSSFSRRDRDRFTSKYYLSKAKRTLDSVSGCMAVSPHLLSQAPSSIPKLLLRGILSDAIVSAQQLQNGERQNRVVFSGTHSKTKGLEQLIKAWEMVGPSNWELHIAGHGAMTDRLHEMAVASCGIVFHGLLNPHENARLLSSAKIGISPEDVSLTPGNVFAFKAIECLAAGLHVITTPMGLLEPELEQGITYIPDNKPETIAATLKRVITGRYYEKTAAEAAFRIYGPGATSVALTDLVNRTVETARERKRAFAESQPVHKSPAPHRVGAAD